jgi:hypothetical protein
MDMLLDMIRVKLDETGYEQVTLEADPFFRCVSLANFLDDSPRRGDPALLDYPVSQDDPCVCQKKLGAARHIFLHHIDLACEQPRQLARPIADVKLGWCPVVESTTDTVILRTMSQNRSE